MEKSSFFNSNTHESSLINTEHCQGQGSSDELSVIFVSCHEDQLPNKNLLEHRGKGAVQFSLGKIMKITTRIQTNVS